MHVTFVPLLAMCNTEHGSGLGRWRWVVERTFAGLNQFRRLRVRYEKRACAPTVLCRAPRQAAVEVSDFCQFWTEQRKQRAGRNRATAKWPITLQSALGLIVREAQQHG